MRLFVSVGLPDRFAEQIAEVQASLTEASGIRLTDPTQAHVTLQFLGHVDDDQLPALTAELTAAVDEAGVDPFEVRYGGLGVFPSLDYISVVWIGVERGATGLERLHDAIEDRTVRLGFESDDHAFTPHVTIARMDHAGGKSVVQELLETHDLTIGESRVEAVHLTASVLTDDGPVYSTVERFELG